MVDADDELYRAAAAGFGAGPSVQEPCDRCGTYANLVERGERRICAACDARRHPIVREPFDAWHIFKGALRLSPTVGLRAAAVILLLNLPASVLVLAIPEGARTLVDLVWGAIFTPVTTGFTLALAHRVVEGGEPAFGPALATALRRWPLLFATNFVYGLAVAAGMLACLLPGIYLALIFSLSSPLVVNEGATPVAALGESAARLRNGRIHAFIAFFLVWAAVIALYAAFALVTGIVVGVAAGPDVDSPLFVMLDVLIGWLASLVTLPVILASAVMYEKLPSSLAVD